MNQDFNPYQAPKAVLEVEAPMAESGLLAEPSRCAGFAANGWWGAAWSTLADNPKKWFVIGIVYLLVQLAVSLLAALLGIIPIIGQIIGGVLSCSISFLMYGGFMQAFHVDADNEEPEVGHLFAGFNERFWDFVLLSLTMIGLFILVIIPVGIVGAVLGVGGAFSSPGQAGVGVLLLALVFIGLLVPVMMLGVFAAPLMLINELKPIDAMKLSFKGCWVNFLPLFWFGVLAFFGILALYVVVGGLSFLLLSTLGWLSLLLLIPLGIGVYGLLASFMVGMNYNAYREIFLE